VDEPRLSDELKKMPEEPLLPIEKKLVAWSLALGVFLLIVLLAASRIFAGK
jgi:hypothetical protein